MRTSRSNTNLRRQVISEACAWFVDFRSGDASASTRDRFDEWLRHSPEHIQAYLEVAAAWAELPTSDPQGRIDVAAVLERARTSLDDDVVVSLAAKSAQRGEPQGPAAPNARRRAFPARRALAAGIVLVVIIAGVAGWLNLRRGDTYTTDIGEQRTIRLPDDSRVDLNARSRIRVRFSKTMRTVELMDGQALFHVAKDPNRPFIVRSDAMAVRAVGTQFDVYRKGSGMVVTVVEGRVAVIPGMSGLDVSSDSDSESGSTATAAGSDAKGHSSPAVPTGPRAAARSGQQSDSAAAGETVFLSAGEQLTVTAATASTPHRADVGVATAWLQRRLIFEDTPLAQVAEEFNRYSVRRLIIDDPELARQPISGVYSSSDPSALVGFLQAQPMLEVLEGDREIRVTRRAPAPDAHSGR